MSAYSDSDRTSRVMYGYVSEAARVPDMSRFQQSAINVGIWAATGSDRAVDALKFRLKPN